MQGVKGPKFAAMSLTAAKGLERDIRGSQNCYWTCCINFMQRLPFKDLNFQNCLRSWGYIKVYDLGTGFCIVLSCSLFSLVDKLLNFVSFENKDIWRQRNAIDMQLFSIFSLLLSLMCSLTVLGPSTLLVSSFQFKS